MAILIEWAVPSASRWAASVAGIGVIALAVAPLAEEPWPEKTYGGQFREYMTQVQRNL